MKSAQKALAVPYHEQSDAGRVIMIPMTVLYGKKKHMSYSNHFKDGKWEYAIETLTEAKR